MDIRLAPMEGLTDAVFRRVQHQRFGGIEKYYIPFITPSHHHVFTTRDLRAIAPANNAGMHCIPQLLTRDAELFLWAARELQQMGYDEVNLNTGCPSGTVTAKGRGSGALRDHDVLRAFLDGIFAASPLPVSIKTRIGFYDPAEWPALLEIFSGYPVKELIIHPRTRNEFYKGEVHMDCFDAAMEKGLPLVFNGNLFGTEDCARLQLRHPDMPMMIGRALIANPALGRVLHGGAPASHDELRNYHDALMAEYSREYPDSTVHSRMREHMKYLSCCFQDSRKALKALRKSTPATYPAAAEMLFSLPLCDDPVYDPDVFSK